jgi:hypothetical protein
MRRAASGRQVVLRYPPHRAATVQFHLPEQVVCYFALGGRGVIPTPAHWDCAAWIGLTICGTKRPSIGNLPSRPTILSSRTSCLSWRPCVKRAHNKLSPPSSRLLSVTESVALPPDLGSDGHFFNSVPLECADHAFRGNALDRRRAIGDCDTGTSSLLRDEREANVH